MTEARRVSPREQYRSFVARHEVAWELAFAALAVVFVGLAFVPFEPGSATETTVLVLEWVITGVFIAEFASRLWAAESRREYVRGHWIDLISCIPRPAGCDRSGSSACSASFARSRASAGR